MSHHFHVLLRHQLKSLCAMADETGRFSNLSAPGKVNTYFFFPQEEKGSEEIRIHNSQAGKREPCKSAKPWPRRAASFVLDNQHISKSSV